MEGLPGIIMHHPFTHPAHPSRADSPAVLITKGVCKLAGAAVCLSSAAGAHLWMSQFFGGSKVAPVAIPVGIILLGGAVKLSLGGVNDISYYPIEGVKVVYQRAALSIAHLRARL